MAGKSSSDPTGMGAAQRRAYRSCLSRDPSTLSIGKRAFMRSMRMLYPECCERVRLELANTQALRQRSALAARDVA